MRPSARPRTATGAVSGIIAVTVIAAAAACGGGHPSTAPTTGPPVSQVTATVTAPTRTATATATSSPSVTGGPVPTGFEPVSVTFVSSTEGFVLGTTPSCASAPCTSVLRTTDAGAHWVGVAAPREGLAGNGSQTGLTGLRFADARDGVAYGRDGLWATHDGAVSWHRLANPTGTVDSVVATDGTFFVALRGASDATQLLRGTAGSDAYAAVPGVVSTGAYLVGAGGDVLFTGSSLTTVVSAAGRVLRTVENPAAECQLGASTALDYLASCGQGAGGGDMGVREVYGTTDGGTRWARLPTPACSGFDGNASAETTGGHAVIAGASSGGGELCVTTDAAHSWSVRLEPTTHDGAGFGDVGFTTTMFGEAVFDPASMSVPQDTATSTLYLTRDGGVSWSAVGF